MLENFLSQTREQVSQNIKKSIGNSNLIETLIKKVKQEVFSKSGENLELEIKIIGDEK